MYTLARGAVVHIYPYDFIDVVKYGYGPVLRFVGVILVSAGVILGIFWGLDRLLSKPQSENQNSAIL
jgi:hypothetical protein